MKKLFLTLVITLSTVATVNAQEIGQFWLGGSFGFWTDKVAGGESISSFQFLPEVGYAVNDNIGVGISLGYRSLEEMEYDDWDGKYYKDRVNTFIVSPYVRWAFLKGHFGGMFLDGGLQYSYGTIDDNDDYSVQNIEVGVRPGIAINVSRNVSITGKFGFIGYRHIKESEGKYNLHINSFGIDLDMSQFLVGAIVKF